MGLLRKWYYRMFPTYKIIKRVSVGYLEADRLIRESADKPETQRWVLDTELEDSNRMFGIIVFLCTKERIK